MTLSAYTVTAHQKTIKLRLFFSLVKMAENEEGEVQDMIKEVDKYYDPLLNDLDMVTLTEEDMDNKSGSQNGLRGVDMKDPAKDKQRSMATRERQGTPGEAQKSGFLCHEQAVCITTSTSMGTTLRAAYFVVIVLRKATSQNPD